MTVEIFTTVVNRPPFVAYQARLFRKYLRNAYRFHVVDDSIDAGLTEQFRAVCAAHGITYHRRRRRPRRGTPSDATAAALQWTYDRLIAREHRGQIALLLDSDMFLVEEFDVQAFVTGYTIAGLRQTRGHVDYLWNGLLMLNMPEIVRMGGDLDFSTGVIDGHPLDTGGRLHHFIHRAGVLVRETDPDCHPRYPSEYRGVKLRDPALTGGYDMELHCDGRFLHYRAASNWFGDWRSASDPLPGKTGMLERIMAACL